MKTELSCDVWRKLDGTLVLDFTAPEAAPLVDLQVVPVSLRALSKTQVALLRRAAAHAWGLMICPGGRGSGWQRTARSLAKRG